MMKKWKYNILILGCMLISFAGKAQLSVQGLLHVQTGASLHVWNDVEISSENGVLENAGTIEVEGNWTREAASNFDGNPSGNGARLVVFRNNDFNTDGNQRISGMMTADNAFYNLEIDNTGTEQLVDLNADIEITRGLKFSNGRIRTDVLSQVSGDGSAYAFTVFVSNSNNDAITGQTMMAGTDRYIEGRLIRAVEGMGTYSFPIGISPDLLDGAEPFEVTFTAIAPISNITAAFQLATTTTTGETRSCDLGPAPNYGTPDGTPDELTIDCVAGQWVTTGDGANYSFDIELLPGSNFLNTCNNAILYYLAKDGDFGDCPDFSGSTGIVGTGLNTFGNFDVPTVSENSISTSLDLIAYNDNRIRIFPNPVSSQKPLFIDIKGDVFGKEQIILEVFDAMGRLVYREENVNPVGQHQVSLDNLSTGIFQFVLKNTKVIANRSVVLQR